MAKFEAFFINSLSNVQPNTDYSSAAFSVAKNSTISQLFLEASSPLLQGIAVTATINGEFTYTGSKGSINAVSGFAGNIEIFLSGSLWSRESYIPAFDIAYFAADTDAKNKINYVYDLSLLGRADVFVGSDALNGPEDSILGLAGNDIFTGNSANDYFDGGSGIDTAIFRGASGNYTINASSAISDKADLAGSAKLTGYLVKDNTPSRDGTDSLINVERLKFSNVNVALDIATTNSVGGIYRLYKAALDRTPDAIGLGYWISQADDGTKDAVKMASDFTYTTEFKTLYGVRTIDNYMTGENISKLVEGFYQNILERSPDTGGLRYFSGLIISKEKTAGQVLADIADSAENRALIIGQISSGIEYVPWLG